MAVTQYDLSLDVSKNSPSMQVVTIGQGEKLGTRLAVALYAAGEALDMTGRTARFCMRLPGQADYYRVAGAVSGSAATFDLDNAYAAAVAGVTDEAYVEVLEGDDVVCQTQRVRVAVLPSATDGGSEAEAYVPRVERMLEELEAGLADASDATDAATSAAGAATAAAESASAAASSAASAAESANTAASAASSAASEASAAAEAANAAAASADEAHDAIEELIEEGLQVPLMTASTRGGAKLGEGLAVEDGALSALSWVEYETVGGRELPTLVMGD